MADKDRKLPERSSRADVDSFLRQVAATPAVKAAGQRGRLLFAMDATASREPTWDQACHIQAQMFQETASLGGLEIQLCYYRGFGEFTATAWLRDSQALQAQMLAVSCLGGHTQIAKVLRHALAETRVRKIDALVFVGDCLEEDVDHLSQLAGELGMLGVRAFVFHEGRDDVAERAFRQIAKLTKGAYCRFDAGSAQQLRDLLSAVAVYAAGGRRALQDFSQRRGGIAGQLTHQLGD